MNKNVERVLEKFNIEEAELEKRLSVMPKEYQDVFKAKWGMDEAGNYCNTYTLLAKKIECEYESAKVQLLYAEKAFEDAKLVVEIFLPQEYDMKSYELAVSYSRLIRAFSGNMLLNPRNCLESTEMVDEMLKMLTERERFIITKRYNLDKSNSTAYKEIADMLEINRERVRQIEAKALRKLKRQAMAQDWLYDLNKETGPRIDNNREIDRLDISVRAYYCLRRAKITTLKQLSEMTIEEFINKSHSIGSKVVEEICEKLKENGLSFKE